MSWIILTLYFLRLTIHKPLNREVIVPLPRPTGRLGLSEFSCACPVKIDNHGTQKCYSIIVLGKLAKRLFLLTETLPHVARAGDVFYSVGILLGLILWGFAIVWFIVAVIMIAVSGGFTFNMRRWGFVFPIGQYSCLSPLYSRASRNEFGTGVFTLLTVTIGDKLES